MTTPNQRSTSADRASESVSRTLSQVRTYLAQESPRRLSEADTKANFIEPVITALGWVGIGSVTREYYVRNSQEFIDYVMFGQASSQDRSGPLLAIEAKSLQQELTEKHAAQLIQYCSVEGIEWAALTNGRELQFFNTFLKPDLEAKRILKLDLLAFNSEAEFDAVFAQLWRLSMESLTEPSGIRTWLNQLRLDAEIRQVLLDPSSQTVSQLRRKLSQADVNASANDIVAWFRRHLAPAILDISPTEASQSKPSVIQQATRVKPNLPAKPASSVDDIEPTASSDDVPHEPDMKRPQTKQYFRVALRDLINVGLILPGTSLILKSGSRICAEATLHKDGQIEWNGSLFASPSDKQFARAIAPSRTSINGWIHWFALLPEGSVSLATLRDRFLSMDSAPTMSRAG